jgi:predicted ATP-binding protein involved in virulence
MRVFTSWSGERSKAAAFGLKSLLQDLFEDTVQVFVSDGITPGEGWAQRFGTELGQAEFGILCITDDNWQSPWLLLEAGAIANKFASSRVVPYLIDALPPASERSPLSQFQKVRADREGTYQLVEYINGIRENPKDPDRLAKSFRKWWPDLEQTLTRLKSNRSVQDHIQPRTVFLSYSHRDLPIAETYARALEKEGIPVWWNLNSIPLGADWGEFITEQVLTSICAIVLWSRSSITSEWVLREAEVALQRRILIPVVIEDVPIPAKFGRIQAVSLSHWQGDSSDPGFQRLLSGVRNFMRTAPSSAEETRLYKQSQRSAERRAEDLFLRNLRSESTIEHLLLKNTSFYSELSWNINPGINILLGRNGYGKTYLLRSVLALLQYHDKAALSTLGDGSGSISLMQDGEERSIHFSDHFFDEEGAVGKLPVLAIPDMRFVNRAVTTLSAISDETTGREDRADLGSYGAWHFLEERPYESMIQGFLYGLCLDYFQREFSFEGEQFNLVRGVVRELTDQCFEFDRVAREGRDRFTLYVRTEGNESNPLPIQKASQGTISVIAMFGLIYDFLKSLQSETVPEVCKRSGIVIIDEVDAHLHPVWQQKIVSLLRNSFPRVQFIITAHNPIAVAGCLEDEVSVLRKNSDHGFSLFQFPNDFVGWQAEDIYRKVFGIENPDESFALYDAMRPFKAQLEQQAVGLASRFARNRDEDRSLSEIEDKLLYIERVEQARSQRLTQEELERENRTLSDRLLGLESAHQSAAEKRRELEQVKAELDESHAVLVKIERRRHRSVILSVTAVILLFIIGSLMTSLRHNIYGKIAIVVVALSLLVLSSLLSLLVGVRR